jgi:hypothetical protein
MSAKRSAKAPQKIMTRFAMLALVTLSAVAEAETTAADTQLGSVFIEESVEVQTQVCSQRFPSTKTAWSSELKRWKEHNAAELKDMRALSLELEAASLKKPSLSAQFVAFRAQGATLTLLALASHRDQEAEPLCEKLRAQLSDDKWADQVFRQARAAAAATLANVKEVPK